MPATEPNVKNALATPIITSIPISGGIKNRRKAVMIAASVPI